MNDYTLTEVFNIVYSKEFSEFDNPPGHFFSRRHRKAMKEILYPQTTSTFAVSRKIPLKKRVIIAVLVILLSALGITAGAAISRGFTRKEHRDNTELFAVNAENAPKTIEYVYYLLEIPGGYEFSENVSDPWHEATTYTNSVTRRNLVIHQIVKEGYKTHYDNEHSVLENICFDGHTGLYLHSKENEEVWGVIIWDNDDYVLEITGDFDKKTLIDLAKALKIRDV